MENVKLALQSLTKGISQSKNKASPDVEIAIIKLPAVLELFPEDTLTDEAFLKFSDLLRHTIQPLYRQNLDLALNFTSAVFSALHTAKVSSAKDASSRTVWEMIQSSILSGLLDHLDDHRTVKIKGPICQAFFPSLCKLYFPTSPEGRIAAHSDLITTASLISVFMLLSELVCGHAAGATGFRKELNEGRRLGYAVLNMRDFLPLEALLELFANLLFSFKNGKSNRTKFIQDAFNASLFHSPQLVATWVKVTSSSIWESTSSDVIKIISSLNVAFPQPFDVSNFQLKGLQTENVDSLYIESASVVLTIPSDEGDDTLTIPFRHVVDFTISSSERDVTVSLAMKKPPVIGKKPLETKYNIIACQWAMENDDVKRFLNTLKHRKVPVNSSRLDSQRKLSVAEAISLDLSSDVGPPKPTQEKAIAIAKLWDGTGQSHGADNVTTSPLLHAIFPPKSGELNATSLIDEPSVFIDDKGNLADLPTQQDRKPGFDSSPMESTRMPKVSSDDLLKRSLSLLMSASNRAQDEGDDAQPRTTRRRKSHNIIVSDNESELTDADEDQSYAPTPTPSRRRSPRLNRVSRAPALERIPEGKVAPAPAPVAKKKSTPTVQGVEPCPTIRTRSARNKENEDAVKPAPPKSLKRSVSPELATPSDEEPPLPPAKKARRSPKKEEQQRPKVRPTTRYGNKMKAPPPTTIDLVDDDDDEPKTNPKPNSKTTTKRQEVESQRTGKKTTQMKDRAGKPKPRPVPINKKTTRSMAKERVKAGVDEDIEMEDAKPALSGLKQVEPEHQPMPVVKTEPNPVKLDTTTPHPKAREAKNAKPSSHKPREAVWQRDSFMAKLEAQKQSTPPREIVPEEASDPVSEAPDGAFRFDSEPAIPPVIKSAPSEDLVEPIGGHVNFGSDTFVTGPPLAEYYIPLKSAAETSPVPEDEPIVVKEEPEDIAMIDLTSPARESSLASPIPMPARSSTPPPAPVKPGRKVAVAPSAHSKPELKKVPAPFIAAAPVPRRQEVLELRELSEVKRGKPQGVNEIERKAGEVKPKAGPAPSSAKPSERQDDHLEVEEGQYDLEPVQPKEYFPKPIQTIVQQYQHPKPAHTQHRQRAKGKQSQGYKLQRPLVYAQGRRPEQRTSTYPKQQRFVSGPPREKFEFGNGVNSLQKEVRTRVPASDIAEVLREIQEALADRVNNRFEETRQEMSQAQLALLHQAADDLKPMAHEAAEHVHALVELEAEYGTHRRKIMTGIDTLRKSTTQLTGALKQVVQNHNRNSLAKKFPSKLFSKPPPRFDSDWKF